MTAVLRRGYARPDRRQHWKRADSSRWLIGNWREPDGAPDITRIPDQPSSIAAWTSATRRSRRRSATSCGPGSTSTCPRSSAATAAAAARFDGPEIRAVEPRAPRRRLGRDLVAGGVRRPRAVAPVPGDLPRGGGAGRGAAAHRRDRARHGGADDHQPRHRGAEGALPRAAPGGRRDLVPGVLGARRRLRPRGRPHLRAARRRPLRPRRAEGLVVVRAHRRLLHPRRALRPGLAAARGPDVPDRRHARAGRRGAAAHARSPARPSSTRSS